MFQFAGAAITAGLLAACAAATPVPAQPPRVNTAAVPQTVVATPAGKEPRATDTRAAESTPAAAPTSANGAPRPGETHAADTRAAESAPSQVPNRDALARMQAAWKADVDAFAIPGKPGFFADFPGGQTPSAVWSHSQGIAAALDMAELSGDYATVKPMLSTLDEYLFEGGYTPYPGERPSASGEVPKRWYDDNGTAGLDLLQAYAQTGDRTYLDKARTVFEFVKTGQHPGGGMLQRTVSDPKSSAMSATGSDTQMALRLYIATHEQEYLSFAQKNYQFMQETLRVNGKNDKGFPEGLYWGQVGPEGGQEGPATGPIVYAGVNSYNQGFPIESDVLLFRITGDKAYLNDAGKTATLALNYWDKQRLWEDAPAFNAIFFRNLLALDQVAPNPSYRQALDSYLEEVWTRARNPKTGLFDQGGIGHYQQAGNYLDQSALVQLFALSQWPPQSLDMVH